MVLEIPHFKVRNLSKMDVTICRFLASFSREYDISDAILRDIDKMKVQYFMSLLSDLFIFLQSVRSEQRNSTQTRKFASVQKQKTIVFSQ